MSFDDLPPQTSINPRADAYAEKCLASSREAARQVKNKSDIAYGPNYWQKLDVFMPDAVSDPLPVLLFLHGGGWTHGYKEWCGFMAPAITRFPAIFVSGSYRLMPEAPYPAAVEDGFATLRWIQDNIGGMGGDPNRVFVGGHSAGGHIAALLALRHDWRERAGVREDLIKACFPISATFSRRMVNGTAAPVDAPREPFAEAYEDSPLALAHQARIPFYVIWGSDEREWVQQSGAAMVAALKQAGQLADHDVCAGSDHFQSHLKTASPDDPWTQKVRSWMTQGVPEA